MRGAITRGLSLVAALVLAAMIGACGSSGSSTSASSRLRPALDGSGENLFNGVRGGTLTVYDHADFQHLDPGEAYFVLDYDLIYATQRPLYSYLPNQTKRCRRIWRRGHRSSLRTVGR